MTTETSLGRRICNISNKIRRSINLDVHGTLEPEGFGFNGPVIGFIGERQRDGEPVGLKDLEGCFGLTRSGASRLVSRLAQGGWVTVETMADDARRKTVTLTPKAREFSRRLDAIGAQSEQRMAEGFSPQELAQLTAYLKRYEANLDRMLVQEDRS